MGGTVIIVTYHFGPDDECNYNRLIRGLRCLDGQLEVADRIILVANGERDGKKAQSPTQLINSTHGLTPGNYIPCSIAYNRKNTGGLNIGIRAALRTDCQFIGLVQSSVTVSNSWIKEIRSVIRPENSGGMGPIVDESRQNRVWCDGHYLKSGRTMNHQYDKRLNPNGDVSLTRHRFPCLSACLIRRDAVEAVVHKYGNFVCEHLPHYGDCTDVALRMHAVGHANFARNPVAVSLKRWPTQDRRNILASQLLCARRHYTGRISETEQRLLASKNDDDIAYYDDAAMHAIDLHNLPYSPLGTSPPVAPAVFDKEWGMS
jgi:GT2 family glycosyltransferase